mmetsp:Transcript_10762/g.15748  ORF Transcript_10762/g.15748 Transcript_10762/m.15748 type:complete len:261 (+) Transcript_10762:61-843(+)
MFKKSQQLAKKIIKIKKQKKPTLLIGGRTLPKSIDLTKEAIQHGREHEWTVKLGKVKEKDYEGCYEAVQYPEIWTYIPRPPPIGREAFEPFFKDMINNKNRHAFIVREGTDIVGSTSYYDINDSHRQVEIGYTHIRPEYWRTSVNTQAKLMMLQHAFEELHCIRVQFRTDEQNGRSRAALERIGAVYEGIRRNDRILEDGRTRNCVFYSILQEEWPMVKSNLYTLLMKHEAEKRNVILETPSSLKTTTTIIKPNEQTTIL